MAQQTSPDPYAHWRARLAGATLPIHANEPQCGYYLTKNNGVPVAAAIYLDTARDRAMICIVGTEYVDARSVWLRLARKPISEEAARHWFEHGRWLHEPDPSAAVQEPEPSDGAGMAPVSRVPGIGDNSGGGPDDNFAQLSRAAQIEVEHATDWLARTPQIKTQTDADVCGDKIEALRKLWKRADDARQVEKAPHLQACNDTDDKWRSTLASLKKAGDALKGAAVAWKEAEDARRASEEAEAQRLRAEREAAAEVRGEPVPLDPEPERPKPEPVRIGGTAGKRVGFKTLTSVIVTDIGKAFRLRAVREHPDVAAAIERACNELFKQTDKVPSGCELKKQTKAA